MNMKNISFAAVIVTYNRKEILKKAIESILNQTYKVNKIVVIDNNSSDGTSDMITENGFIYLPNFHYIKLQRNTGGSGGFYEGLKYLKDDSAIDWIAISDDDFIYDRDFFFHIANYIKSSNYENNIIAITGTVIENGEIAYMTRRILIDKITFRQKIVEREYYNRESFEYDLLSFAGCVIRRDVLNKVGLPEKDYFICFDDTEFSIRLSSLGKIVNVNRALGYHMVPVPSAISSNKAKLNWKYFYCFRNSIHMALKHSTCRPITFFFVTFRVLKAIAAVLLKPMYKGSRRSFLKMLCKAYLQAISGKLCVVLEYHPETYNPKSGKN